MAISEEVGQHLTHVIQDIEEPNDLKKASAVAWKQVHLHSAEAECDCIVLAALDALYGLGYVLVKKDVVD